MSSQNLNPCSGLSLWTRTLDQNYPRAGGTAVLHGSLGSRYFSTSTDTLHFAVFLQWYCRSHQQYFLIHFRWYLESVIVN